MNTPNEETKDVENSAYNPFPEPQTIPAGWDLSGLFSGTRLKCWSMRKKLKAKK